MSLRVDLTMLAEELHGFEWMEYHYLCEIKDNHVEITYVSTQNMMQPTTGVLCRVYQHFTEIVNPIHMPHHITRTIARYFPG